MRSLDELLNELPSIYGATIGATISPHNSSVCAWRWWGSGASRLARGGKKSPLEIFQCLDPDG